MKNLLLIIALWIFSGIGTMVAQNLRPDTRPPVFINGNILQNPWTGGANSPVISQIDLNGDGKLDLITFDVVGSRLSTYLNIGHTGQINYRYAPQYQNKFPGLHDWVRTYDFDCDGDLDLFTYGNAGITVYQNDYSTATGLKFSLFTNQINTYYGSIQTNLYVNGVTIPAFADVDGDGDMDILSFPVSGSWVEFHKNYAMDSTGNCAGLLFHIQFHYPSSIPEMWGHFFLSGMSNVAMLNIQRPAPPDPFNQQTKLTNHDLHSGSALWGFDFECDNDIDLFNGDILGSNLLFLKNGGPPDSMVTQDTLFPSYDTPVHMENIPCPALLDVDNDGKKDLLVTSLATVGEDYNNVWLYNNQADNCNPYFHYTTNRFLVDQMIDVGTSARPVFVDVDADGLQDMLIANLQYYNNANPSASYSRIAYFRNTGSTTFPIFTLIDKDYANCSSLGVLGLHPAFGDLDGDGDQDLLMGTDAGTIIYYENTAGAGNPLNLTFMQGSYFAIDVGANSAPQIIDVDKDGLPDLLIGERAGNLNYYHNNGTANSPLFSTLTSNNFGGVNVIKTNAIQGNSAPLLFTHNGGYELLVGSESGYVYQYNNIDGNLSGVFTLVDSTYQNIYEPSHATIAMADIDGDSKFDLLVGCQAGGVRLYTQRNPVIISHPHTAIAYNSAKVGDENDNTNASTFSLFPSPATENLNIQINKNESSPFSLQIIDLLGEQVLALSKITSSSISVDIHTLEAGIYFVRVKNANGESIQKFIKQ